MEHHQTALREVRSKLPQHLRGVVLKHQNVTTNDRIERPLEPHPGRIPRAEGNVAQRSAISPRLRDVQGRGLAVYPDNFPRITHKLSGDEGDIACAGAYIEYPHTHGDPGLVKEPPGYRTKQPRLGTQPIELTIGMAENVVTGRTRLFVGLRHLKSFPELIEQRPGVLQIGGVETFAEPVVPLL
jgi:hypothetical protein